MTAPVHTGAVFSLYQISSAWQTRRRVRRYTAYISKEIVRISSRQAANAVLSAKLEEMEHLGLIADMQIALPEQLSISDVDLCALLGNALDNAMEAAVKAPDKRITLRCRVEKGVLMLKVTNALTGEETAELHSTKADSAQHGFGLPGMREIAGRYGGSLEAGPREGRFELLACLPVTAPGG